MKKLFIFLSLSTALFADTPKPNVFTFSVPRAACSMVDGKLLLSRAWPLGSWEDCAYALLSVAQQLDNLRDKAEKETNALKQLVESNKKLDIKK